MKRLINVCGFDVEVISFGYATFFYPCFNGNAEFPTTSKGFRELHSYLRTVKYFEKLLSI